MSFISKKDLQPRYQQGNRSWFTMVVPGKNDTTTVNYYFEIQDGSPAKNTGVYINDSCYYDIIYHPPDITPPTVHQVYWEPKQPNVHDIILVYVNVSDTSGIQKVTFWYELQNNGIWNKVPMLQQDTGCYWTQLHFNKPTSVTFYITVQDAALDPNTRLENNSGTYYHIKIVDTSNSQPTAFGLAGSGIIIGLGGLAYLKKNCLRRRNKNEVGLDA